MRALLMTATLVAFATAATLYGNGPVPQGWELLPGTKSHPEERVEMTLGLRRRNDAATEKLFWEVSDPSHAKYGEHVTSDDAIRRLHAPSAAQLEAVKTWLARHSAQNVAVTNHHDYVTFSATIAQIEKLFSVKFAAYKHKSTNAVVNRAVGPVTLPDELAQVIEVVAGHRGFPLPRRGGKQGAKRAGGPMPPWTPPPTEVPMNVTPAVIWKAYNVTTFPSPPAGTYNLASFFQAQGQSVLQSDMDLFCNSFLPAVNMSSCKVSKYIGDNEQGPAGDESSLDSEYLFGVSNGVEMWAYSLNGIDFCGDLMRWAAWVFNGTSSKHPYVISMSYGSQMLPNFCAGPDVQRLSMDIRKMGLQGISVMIASGDSGSGEYSREGYNEGLLGASMPASIPYCTAVGSTTFVSGNSGEEEATTAFGSGGGFSFDYAQPTYQQAAVQNFLSTSSKLPPKLSYNASGRATPDVSALGWQFTVVSNGMYEGIGGTSASTPTFSGLVSRLNAIRLANGKTLGFLNPLLYGNADAFNDVVKGNNDVSGDGYGWYAQAGWDPATGLGTPNFGKLADVVKAINAKENARKQ